MSEKNTNTSDGGGGGGDGDMMYSVGEKVLAYHGPRIYQAIVKKAELRKNKWNYFVHYSDSSESSDKWVGVDRVMKYTEENIVKQQALDEELLVNGIKWLLNSKPGSTQTRPEILNDVKVEKEDGTSGGAKGKKKVGGSGTKDEDCRGPNMIDFISQMPNDILLKILSLLPLKNAVITGILSKRWRFVWPYLTRLVFDGSEALDEIDEIRCIIKHAKYISQVNRVIRSHMSPTLQLFRIRFDLDKRCFKDIDKWLRFALDKRVELLELNLLENYHKSRDTKDNYDLPLPLSDGSMVRLSEWPPSSSMVVETLSIKKLLLMRVNISEPSLIGLLKNSPHLETLSIHGSGLLTHVNVGGRDINLKHFILMGWAELQSISLWDFDLEKFLYIGRDIEIRLTNLSKIKELDIGQVSVGLNNKVFSVISCVASTLEVLSLDIDRQTVDIERDAPGFPVLPNVKTLNLTLPTEVNDHLTEFFEIAKKCPSLETFIISLHWCAPITREKAWYAPLGHDFSPLKLLEIHGYRGIMSDVEIPMYMAFNSYKSLKKIVIDPSCHPYDLFELTESKARKREEAGRSHAKSQLSSGMPPWVELVVL